jgi:hypothetical protein
LPKYTKVPLYEKVLPKLVLPLHTTLAVPLSQMPVFLLNLKSLMVVATVAVIEFEFPIFMVNVPLRPAFPLQVKELELSIIPDIVKAPSDVITPNELGDT